VKDFDLRPVELDEVDAFAACQASAFGHRHTAEQLANLAEELVVARSLAVLDHGEIVGTANSHVELMTLPGLSRCDVAAVTEVSVAPTHRRRGLLTSMMRRQLDDLRDGHEPLAVLLASEGSIYARFGYGVATFAARYLVDKRRARLSAPVAPPDGSGSPGGAGSVRLVDRAQAVESFPLVFNEYLPTRVGELNRLNGDWGEVLGEPSGESEDTRSRFFACFEQDGRIDGYAVYRVAPIDPIDRYRRAVFLDDFCSLTDAAYMSLWRYLLGIDLVAELRTGPRPIDEPVRFALEDLRQLQTAALGDRTWVRLVDVPVALAMRGYADSGELILEVTDPFCPWNEGRFRLTVDGGGDAEVERVNSTPDLILPVDALGATYLGGVRFRALAQIGRIVERTQGSLERADRLFNEQRPPFCTTAF
jgi:predicted acetyltransferase